RGRPACPVSAAKRAWQVRPSASQLLAQHRLEIATEHRRVVDGADDGELRDLEARVAAGIDPPERLEIERDVDRDPVVGAVAPHAQPDRRELLPADVDARGVAPRRGLDAVSRDRADDRILERYDEAADVERETPEVDEHVRDD